MNVIGHGYTDQVMTDDEVREIIAQATAEMPIDGKRVLVITPDQTRTCPLPMMAKELHAAITPRATKLDFLIALGTHQPLDEAQIDKLFGIAPGQLAETLPGSEIFNHDWKNPAALRKVGTLSKEKVREISEGRFEMAVDVTINARVFDYDLVMILGPVFPHEVVGFSGGAKYFFPGICGEELLNFFHWLGAVITIPKMIGLKDTAVRQLLHEAAAMLDFDARAMCMVVRENDLAGLYYGSVQEAWRSAADLSDQVHVTYHDHPYDSVLSCAPAMYDELWTGAKCMYKLECVVADGGELIIYAPHITELAVAHGAIIEEIGYHCLAYFLHDWERFKDYPWGVLAHSTHVRGIGEMEGDVEKPRVRVTLATGIPADVCKSINMGYRDPATINPEEWIGFENGGGGPDGSERRLHVPKAGEMLYRLTDAPDWASV